MSNSLKESIKSRFNKSYKTYDQYCSVQNAICDKLLQLFLKNTSIKKNLSSNKSPIKFSCIADFACGTGESTKKIIQCINHDKCYAIDFSDKLLEIAKNKLTSNKVEFVLSDFDSPLFDIPYFDMIFCNMGLQWSFNFLSTLILFNKYLLCNGIMVFSIPINSNFPEITDRHKLKVLRHDDVVKALDMANFELIESLHEKMILTFPNQIEALKSLKYVGANNKSEQQSHKAGLCKNNIKNVFIDPSVSSLTYEIGIYLSIKR